MIIYVELIDQAGTPILDANVVHFEGCCNYGSETNYVDGRYRVEIFSTDLRQTHIITASAPAYRTRTVYIRRGLFEKEIWYTTIILELYNMVSVDIHHDEPGVGGSDWMINDNDRIAMQCSAIAVSTKKPCRHRTVEEFCYQHKHIITPEMNKYAGKWKMFGRQLLVERSGWEADLEMLANGIIKWRQTKGANVGAKRTGCWTLKDKKIIIRYLAPNVGRVEWETTNINTENMYGNYRTPDVSFRDCGWGGEWNATKSPDKA